MHRHQGYYTKKHISYQNYFMVYITLKTSDINVRNKQIYYAEYNIFLAILFFISSYSLLGESIC